MLKQIPFTEFKTMLAKDIKGSKSFEVTADGELLFIAAIPKTTYEREAVRKLANTGNNVHGGKEI